MTSPASATSRTCGDGRGVHQEERLSPPGAQLAQGLGRVLRVPEVRLGGLRLGRDAEDALEDAGVQDGHVGPPQDRGLAAEGRVRVEVDVAAERQERDAAVARRGGDARAPLPRAAQALEDRLGRRARRERLDLEERASAARRARRRRTTRASARAGASGRRRRSGSSPLARNVMK